MEGSPQKKTIDTVFETIFEHSKNYCYAYNRSVETFKKNKNTVGTQKTSK